MINCDIHSIISSLHYSFANFVSCTKCLDINKIPFLALDIDNTPN